MKLILSPEIMDQIREHGVESYPHECCGFFYGRELEGARLVHEIRRQANERSDSRENRFLITPEQFRAAEKHARQSGQLMLGIYHSHPDSPARPSQYDRDHAWPWYSYLILTVGRGTAGESYAWRLRDDRSGFDPVELEIDVAAHVARDAEPARGTIEGERR